mmetsp:Transcript_21354/g.33874  ORF Transcript_21354/g.33874 Transcript_21354/m.33874 type:complete len:221 (-) Transcript_21354:55-717(-)
MLRSSAFECDCSSSSFRALASSSSMARRPCRQPSSNQVRCCQCRPHSALRSASSCSWRTTCEPVFPISIMACTAASHSCSSNSRSTASSPSNRRRTNSSKPCRPSVSHRASRCAASSFRSSCRSPACSDTICFCRAFCSSLATASSSSLLTTSQSHRSKCSKKQCRKRSSWPITKSCSKVNKSEACSAMTSFRLASSSATSTTEAFFISCSSSLRWTREN